MVLFTVSDKLKEHIRQSGFHADQVDQLLGQKHISDRDLVAVYRTVPSTNLVTFIRDNQCRLYIPNQNDRNELHPKSKEFIASMEKLRREAKEQEYQKLVRPTEQYETLYDNLGQESITPAAASKELKSQITTIVNVLVSVVSVMYAVWYWTDSSMKLQDSWRVLLSLFFGILVLVAEVVVYMGYLNRIEDAKVRERKKREVKKVVTTL